MALEQARSLGHLGETRASSRDTATAPFRHDVQFYESDVFLVAAVCDYFVEGLHSGHGCVAIATQRHRLAIARALARRGVDVPRARSSGQLQLLDAEKTLASFMVDDAVNEALFRDVVGRVFMEQSSPDSRLPVRAFGEMVNLLWQNGNHIAALELEALWNQMGADWNIELLCAYAISNFARSAHAERFEEICGQHSHVVPAESYSRSTETGRLLEIARLQQRAQALEHEVAQRQALESELRGALEEQKRLLVAERAARAEAESASRAKNQFLAVMSHELRTPLNAIAGHTQLLELGLHGPITNAQREALDRIDRSQRHLLALVNDVLNLARVENGRAEYSLEAVEVCSVIHAMVTMIEPLLTSAQLRCRVVEPSPGLAPVIVLADRERLQQIVLNLLTNAIKFTPAGGLITIESAACLDELPMARIDIRDTGVGIPEERIDAVFEPFVQLATTFASRQHGIGLGLTISREFARGMGGDLTVARGVEEGASFRLTLPLAQPPA
jgi:signal transduction histidine kinase